MDVKGILLLLVYVEKLTILGKMIYCNDVLIRFLNLFS